uniref:Trichohyalin-plectin-homology domain-containing protein n=1 Tax=Lygus hesperus TaxID=30085 RepID=A0A0A9YF09_LYGHE
MAARTAKAQEAVVHKNILSEESELRRDALRNMASYKSGVVDDLVKQNRAKTALILKNAGRAIVDKQEEMRDFYGHVGSTQVLAMRELQIEDHKHFKDVGIESGEIFFEKDPKDEEDGEPTEYEEMVIKRAALKEKNMKIVDVLKKQALEREMLKELEVEENLENALRLDALAEAELVKRMTEKDKEEREKQQHFDTFNAIVAYRDYLRQVRVAEDDALWKREKDFLEEKEKFNQAYNDKQNKIKEERLRLVSAVRSDLGSEMEKQEQQDIEYYYTLQKERDIQLEDQEIQEKKNKKEAMEALMREWGRITLANRHIKELEQQRENEEKERMLKFLELENNVKKAEERKRMVDKDINRMEIMYQINERERKRQEDMAAKAQEIKLLRAEGFVREGKIKERRLERMEDFKNNGLPERFLSNIRKHYNL